MVGIQVEDNRVTCHMCYTVSHMSEIQMRKLGWSDIEVPSICLGTMVWGQQNNESEAHEQLSYGVDERGMTFIDTAEIYPIPPTRELQGLTETYIGNWLQKRGRRDDLTIATKVSVSDVVTTRETTNKYDRDNIRAAVEGSLKRLQTDYIDLYQIHWPERQTNFFGVREYVHDSNDGSTPIRETLEVLAELIAEGKVRYIGVSNETPWGVLEYLRLAREEGLPRIVSIQNQYSIMNRHFEIGLSEIAIKEQVGLLPYTVLSGGALSGKYLGGARPEGARFTLFDRNDRYNAPALQPVIEAYVSVAKKHNLDPVQMAVAFATSRDFVTSTIIGSTSVAQMKACIDAGAIQLSDEVMADIQSVHEQYPNLHA